MTNRIELQKSRIAASFEINPYEEIEKGQYKDNAQNKKAGRVGQNYGGGKKEEGGEKPQPKMNPEALDKIARTLDDETLKRTASSSQHEHHRTAAHTEINRRQKEESGAGTEKEDKMLDDHVDAAQNKEGEEGNEKKDESEGSEIEKIKDDYDELRKELDELEKEAKKEQLKRANSVTKNKTNGGVKHKVGDFVVDKDGKKGEVTHADDEEVAVEHENGDVTGYYHEDVESDKNKQEPSKKEGNKSEEENSSKQEINAPRGFEPIKYWSQLPNAEVIKVNVGSIVKPSYKLAEVKQHFNDYVVLTYGENKTKEVSKQSVGNIFIKKSQNQDNYSILGIGSKKKELTNYDILKGWITTEDGNHVFLGGDGKLNYTRKEVESAKKERSSKGSKKDSKQSYKTTQHEPMGGGEKMSFVKIGNSYIDADTTSNNEATSGVPVSELSSETALNSRLDDLRSDKKLSEEDFSSKEIDEAISFLESHLPSRKDVPNANDDKKKERKNSSNKNLLSKLKSKEGLSFEDVKGEIHTAKYKLDKSGLVSGIQIFDKDGKKVSDTAMKPHEIDNWLESTKDFVKEGKKESSKSEKPLTDKQLNPDKFKKPNHEKTAHYKILKGTDKKFVDDLHKLSEISENALTNAEGNSIQEIAQDIYNQVPSPGTDPNDKYSSGGNMYDDSEKKDIKAFNKVFDKHTKGNVLTFSTSFIRDLSLATNLGKWISTEDFKKPISDLVDKYHMGKNPKQLNMFKAYQALGLYKEEDNEVQKSFNGLGGGVKKEELTPFDILKGWVTTKDDKHIFIGKDGNANYTRKEINVAQKEEKKPKIDIRDKFEANLEKLKAERKNESKPKKVKRTKIVEGLKVSGKHGKGEIQRILTASTGYVEVKYDNGIIKKEMGFNLSDENGENLKKKPFSETSGMSRGEKKRYNDRKAIDSFNKKSNLDKIKSSLMWVNGAVYGDRGSQSYQMFADSVSDIKMLAKEKGDSFIQSVAESVDRYMKVSEKQAFVLARFADNNGIKFKD